MPRKDTKGIVFGFESEMQVLLPAGFQRFERLQGQLSRPEFTLLKQINETAACFTAFGTRDHHRKCNIMVP